MSSYLVGTDRAVRAQAPFDGLRQLAGYDLARDGPLLVDVRLPFDEVADWFAARMLG